MANLRANGLLHRKAADNSATFLQFWRISYADALIRSLLLFRRTTAVRATLCLRLCGAGRLARLRACATALLRISCHNLLLFSRASNQVRMAILLSIYALSSSTYLDVPPVRLQYVSCLSQKSLTQYCSHSLNYRLFLATVKRLQ